MAAAAPPAESRGRLTIHEKVVQRIAERAAADVADREPPGSMWDRLGGRPLPRATASVVGRHVRVGVAVRAPVGHSMPELAGAVRDAVTRQVGDLTGLSVDRVDVRVDEVAPFRPPPGAEPLPAATRPAAPGVARKAGLVVALLFLALGIAAIYDALVELDVIGGRRLLVPLLEWLDGLRPRAWMTPVGAAVALAGLMLALSALWRRPRRSLVVNAATGVFATRGAVEELGVDSATSHGGVVDAAARARPGKVAVRVTTDGEAGTVDEVRATVTGRLARLAGPPKIRVGARRRPVPR
ncbi:Asp23/Gls24 family envelope stress response protein [Jiangella asiatica]|uniref:Asp23/Gls24 family envelope stress response protein n=1 Tax=Jiangella asiatica TaxID=2530372 RepID=A0A4V2Z2Q3_9ACTN|nr:Asp23/Gls24 family envelope stress response protein [Jiangella asiatica]TDE09628.1 Asp23/Gls24 family envelope stress response protein [Jiangella asiatica]